MDTIAERLKWARKKAGFEKPTECARDAGWTVSTYLGHENGDRNPSRDTAKKYAKRFGVKWEWLLEGIGSPTIQLQPVEIVGFVGAGSSVNFDGQDQNLGYAPRPPDATTKTVALIVRGASMPGVAEDKWLIYYDQREEFVTDDMIGQLCVCQCEDENVYVKRIYRGKDASHFDLVSIAQETIRDVRIKWAAKVAWIKPN